MNLKKRGFIPFTVFLGSLLLPAGRAQAHHFTAPVPAISSATANLAFVTFSFTNWDLSLLPTNNWPGTYPQIYPYPTGTNALALTKTDDGAPLAANTQYFLHETVVPQQGVAPGVFSFWTMPSSPGSDPQVEAGCDTVQVQIFNSNDPALPNPAGTGYELSFYDSNRCTHGPGPCDNDTYLFLASATVYSKTGLSNEVLTSETQSPAFRTVQGAAFVIIRAISGSNDPTLDSPYSHTASFTFSPNCSITPGTTPALARIDISPSSGFYHAGDQQTFTAQGFDQFGNTIATSVTWSVLDAQTNTVSAANPIVPNGNTVLFTAGNIPGPYKIQAKNNSVTGTAVVNVLPANVPLPVPPPTATFLPPNPNDMADTSAVFRVSNPNGNNFSNWQTSVLRPGMVSSPANHAYPANNQLQITKADDGSNLTPNTPYTLIEQLTPSIIPGNFAFWTRPTTPGNGFPVESCHTVQISIRNSASNTANPAGTNFAVILRNSTNGTLVSSATLQSKTGLATETMEVELGGLNPPGSDLNNPPVYYGTVNALSSSGDSTLDAAGQGEIASFGLNRLDECVLPQFPSTIHRIVVSPQNAAVVVGTSQQYTAQAFDQNDNPISAPVLNWSVTDLNNNPTSLNTISAGGLFTAGSVPGGYYVHASSQILSGGTVIGGADGYTGVTVVPVGTVVPPPPPPPTNPPPPSNPPPPPANVPVFTSIRVSPQTATIGTGAHAQFMATAYDQFGAPFALGTPFVWTNDTPSNTIDSSGFYQAGASAGSDVVRASNQGLQGAAIVTVISTITATPPPPPGQTPFLASILISPQTATIGTGKTAKFLATAYDQYGSIMILGTAFVWSNDNFPLNSIDSTGLYQAGNTAGADIIRVTNQGITGTAAITITSLPPPPPPPPGSNPPGNPGQPGNPGSNPNNPFSGAAADISHAYAYPVPWKSTMGVPVTFDSLAPDTHVRIFTANGRLVKEMYSANGAPILWNIDNMDGQRVASWVYFYILDNPTTHQTKKGKLVIIK